MSTAPALTVYHCVTVTLRHPGSATLWVVRYLHAAGSFYMDVLGGLGKMLLADLPLTSNVNLFSCLHCVSLVSQVPALSLSFLPRSIKVFTS